MQVTFLGTGSGTPSAQRNVSAIIVRLGSRFCLFDCGEGTQHQLKKAHISLNKIDSIMVSHLHGDHIFGLPGLLGTMSLLQRHEALNVVGPVGIKAYLEHALAASYTHLQYNLHIHELSPLTQVSLVHRIHRNKISSISIKHRVPAFGYRLEMAVRPGRFHADRADQLGVPNNHLRQQLTQGESIMLANGETISPEQVMDLSRPGQVFVICTDTEYCPQSVSLADRADLLVHEATYAEKDRALATRGGHSTSHDAAKVAKAATVKQLALTHFSPRYEDMESVLTGVSAIFSNVIVAEDFLQVSIH